MIRQLFLMLALLMQVAIMNTAHADVPNRPPPSGIVPNPGTQQQELTNLTANGTYNVFETPNNCASCHGGTMDQNASHYGNWAGSNMANSARDPFFRANNLIVNADAYYASGVNGVGNICWRCHSPNAWYSARMDESKGGKIDGTMLQQSMVNSSDMQGITCEFCHRTLGNVTTKRQDLVDLGYGDDPAWNLLAGATDWPHAGTPYPEGPVAGLPYGDTSFQFSDSHAYQADFPGDQLMFWSDIPTSGTYTGQTYGIYPPGYTGPKAPVPAGQPQFNALGQEIAYLPSGASTINFPVSVGAPEMVDPLTGMAIPGTRDPDNQALSTYHGTHQGGSTQDGITATGKQYMTTSEMCGTCHDLTVPTLNSGMPEQRTYTEWKFSKYGEVLPDGTEGPNHVICQDCHMGEGQYEYQDGAAGTYKADPAVAGGYPYAKPRQAHAAHRFSPANRDLPKMLKLLNPDVDLELTGGKSSGRDTRTTNGMISNRDAAWDRHARYGELKLRDAARVQVLSGPTSVGGSTYEVQVKVTNLSGHALPSGYPDGRRAFLTLDVKDANGHLLYQSGAYNAQTATLETSPGVPLQRAHDNVIDAAAGKNAVMVYEKRTGFKNADGTYTIGESLLNPVIVFDNRLRPDGWTAEALTAGVRLVDYSGDEKTAVPFDKPGRYPVGQGFDVVTYRFNVPTGAVPATTEAAFNYQSHSREFVEYLKDRNNQESALDAKNVSGRPNTLGGPRPQGTPSMLARNYPNTPNYLGDKIRLTKLKDLNGKPLKDNWGSLAYAAWMLTGKGEPFKIDGDSTAIVAAPASPVSVTATAVDPFAIKVDWTAVAGVDGYVVQARFGTAATTLDPATNTEVPNASWESIAIVRGATTFTHDGLHVEKTYGYRVIAFNGKGESLPSVLAEARTPAAVPFAPTTLALVGATTTNSVSLSWLDASMDELSFVVERRSGNGTYTVVATLASANVPGAGPLSYTDTTVQPGQTYQYRVAAVNSAGTSTYLGPLKARTPKLPKPHNGHGTQVAAQ